MNGEYREEFDISTKYIDAERWDIISYTLTLLDEAVRSQVRQVCSDDPKRIFGYSGYTIHWTTKYDRTYITARFTI